MARKIQGYTRSDGTKVKGHSRKGRSGSKRKYTASQRRALDKSRTSKSGHKTAAKRQKSRKPGLWSNYWSKRRREGTWTPKRKRKS